MGNMTYTPCLVVNRAEQEQRQESQRDNMCQTGKMGITLL